MHIFESRQRKPEKTFLLTKAVKKINLEFPNHQKQQ